MKPQHTGRYLRYPAQGAPVCAALGVGLPLMHAFYQGGGIPRNTVLLIGLALLGLLALAVAVALGVVLWQRSRRRREGPPAGPIGAAPEAAFGFQPAGAPTGLLHILTSEDLMLPGKTISLVQDCTTIGRGAENDLVLPLDNSVSRRHAMIERSGSEFYLSEFVTQELGGEARRPPFGTYVNGQKVGMQPVQLKSGDEIQLGTQFRMRFEKKAASGGKETLTM